MDPAHLLEIRYKEENYWWRVNQRELTMKPNRQAGALVSVVAPIFNEAEVIEQFVEEIRENLRSPEIQSRYELILVDDGSKDRSAEKLDEMAAKYHAEIIVIHLARNFGHAAAVCAGLDHASGDAVILMDADLQDDPSAFAEFLKKWREGYDVVYAIRTSRREAMVKALFFRAFYRILSWIASISLPVDAGNYSLMDRRVVEQLKSLPERNRYLPGLRTWVGFNQVGVPVARRSRYEKATRVGFRGLWRLAMNAVFSFSYVPLFVFRIIGVGTVGLSVALIAVALYQKFFSGKAIPAWVSLLTAISFFGGMNMIALSVIGAYIARIYDEAKGRPLYIIDRISRNG